MTIIAAYVHPDGAIAILGDMLITTPSGLSEGVSLPAQYRETHIGDTKKIVGLKQKVIKLSDRVCVAWAGNMFIARVLMAWIRNNALQYETPAEIIDGLLKEFSGDFDITCVSLIVSIIDRNSADDQFLIKIESFNCHVRETDDGLKIHVAGTGEYHFLDSIRTSNVNCTGESNIGVNTLAKAFGNTALSYHSESQGWANYDFSYGGAFEVATLDISGWRKVTYTIQSWLRDGGTYSPVNPMTIVSYNSNGDAMIDQYMPNGAATFCRRFEVNSPLDNGAPVCKASKIDIEKLNLSSDMTANCLFDTALPLGECGLTLEWKMPPVIVISTCPNGGHQMSIDMERVKNFYSSAL